MAKTMDDLQQMFMEILGSQNVYFQPPENTKIKYPCILFELNDVNTRKADDMDYLSNDRYAVTLIHRDPENTVWREIKKLAYCDLDRIYVADNLYHYVFTLYC